MPPITNPSFVYGTYFHRNYREGQRIELHDLVDWGWNLSGWGVSTSTDPKKKGKKWDPDEEEQFKQKIAKDEWLPSEWIDWKNHRLRKLGFYDSTNMRTYDTDKAPPRLVLRRTPIHEISLPFGRRAASRAQAT